MTHILVRTYGYRAIGQELNVEIIASSSIESAKTPIVSGQGPLHIELNTNPYESVRYVEMEFSAPAVVSGLELTTLKEKSLLKFQVLYIKHGVIFPNTYHSIELNRNTPVVRILHL